MAPGILILSLVGAYATSLSMFSVGMTLFFGVIGYLMIKADLPRAPLVLAVVLAQLMETSLRQPSCCRKEPAASSFNARSRPSFWLSCFFARHAGDRRVHEEQGPAAWPRRTSEISVTVD